MPGMTEQEFLKYLDTVATSALANKAALTCMMAGLPVTEENCVAAYGQWVNPADPSFERMVELTTRHVRQMVETARSFAGPTSGTA